MLETPSDQDKGDRGFRWKRPSLTLPRSLGISSQRGMKHHCFVRMPGSAAEPLLEGAAKYLGEMTDWAYWWCSLLFFSPLVVNCSPSLSICPHLPAIAASTICQITRRKTAHACTYKCPSSSKNHLGKRT